MARSVWCGTFMRAFGLIVGCLATGMAYSMDAFTTYADALKDLFDYRQSEIELIISLGNVGLLSSLPAGLLIRKCGFRILSFVALIISAGSYVLLTLATYNVPYYSKNSVLIAVYYFFSGFGGGFMYITATTVNVRNFDVQYLGIVSGLLHSMKSAVLGVIMATYQAGFSGTAGMTINSSVRGESVEILDVYIDNNNQSDLQIAYTPDAPFGLISTTDYRSTFTDVNDGSNVTPSNDPSDKLGHPANLGGFFMVIAISYAVTNLLGMIVYGNYPQESTFDETVHIVYKPESEKQGLLRKNNKRRERADTGGLEDILTQSSCSIRVASSVYRTQQPIGPFTLIKSYYYHAILWPSIFLIAHRTCYINNLTAFTNSMHVDKYAQDVLLSLVPILGTIVKPVLGVISDAIVTRVPRSATLLLFLLLEAGSAVLCMTVFSNVSVITIGLVLVIFGSCTVQTQSPAILVETFGKDCFSFGWGFITLSWSLCTLGFQMMYGALYDKEVTVGNYCYGQHCFRIYFAITGSLALLTALVVVYAVIKQFRDLRAKRDFLSRISVTRA